MGTHGLPNVQTQMRGLIHANGPSEMPNAIGCTRPDPYGIMEAMGASTNHDDLSQIVWLPQALFRLVYFDHQRSPDASPVHTVTDNTDGVSDDPPQDAHLKSVTTAMLSGGGSYGVWGATCEAPTTDEKEDLADEVEAPRIELADVQHRTMPSEPNIIRAGRKY
ncbi:hypothetical protein CERSUDRAFT_74437 [Gelatoporia subvermispora B]|uniref:Uncharacterized protein n=1 Tax=Ceriporiopsis subvermispora (strain B) TaxID=914234 RepID=M2QHI0_CERS8|nr:hypothetical protein CERSUDRAFT_74437 [Gelatoporia subvermispora B]